MKAEGKSLKIRNRNRFEQIATTISESEKRNKVKVQLTLRHTSERIKQRIIHKAIQLGGKVLTAPEVLIAHDESGVK